MKRFVGLQVRLCGHAEIKPLITRVIFIGLEHTCQERLNELHRRLNAYGEEARPT
jgi:hypothetical protein